MDRKVKFAAAFLFLFLLPFAVTGAIALYLSVKTWLGGDVQQALALFCAGLVFGGVGFGGLYKLLRGLTQVGEAERIRAMHPGEPWLWRPKWAARRIVADLHAQSGFSWSFAIFWNLVSLPCLIFLPKEIHRKPIVAIGLIFPVIGAWLIGMALRDSLRRAKFGASVFVLETLPGVIGGTLKGTIQTRGNFPAGSRIQVKLACVERTRSGSGENSTTWEKIIWEEQVDVLPHPSMEGSGAAIPVAFSIPADGKSTVFGETSYGVDWRLQAVCPVPGLDYEAQFEVPVYLTAATPASSNTPAPTRASVPFDVTACVDVKVQSTGSGKEFYFPPFRYLSVAVTVFVFALLFGGSTAFLIHMHAPLIFPLAFGVFTLVFILIAVSLAAGQTTVAVEGSGARIRKGILGVTLSTTTLASSEIENILLSIGTQAGQNVYYDIKIIRKNGFKTTAGSMIRSKHEAEWVVAEMSRLLRIDHFDKFQRVV